MSGPQGDLRAEITAVLDEWPRMDLAVGTESASFVDELVALFEAGVAAVEAERDLAQENSLNRLAANIALRERAERAEAELAAMTTKADTYQRMYYAEHGEVAAELTALQQRVAAERTQAAAQARHEALIEGWERGFDDGEKDVMQHNDSGWRDGVPCIENPYRAAADSGSSPAVLSGDNIENPPADGWTDADVADFLARDRAQRAAATHEYRPAPWRCECGEPMSNPVHEMHPEDPPHGYKLAASGNSHQWWGTTVCTWETGDGYRQCSRPAAHPIHQATPERPPCFDTYECETRGCYADSVGVSGCEGSAALYGQATPEEPLTATHEYQGPTYDGNGDVDICGYMPEAGVQRYCFKSPDHPIHQATPEETTP